MYNETLPIKKISSLTNFKLTFVNREVKYMTITKTYPQYIHRDFIFLNSYDGKTWTLTFDLDMFKGEISSLKEIKIIKRKGIQYLDFIGVDMKLQPVVLETNNYDNYSIICSKIDDVWHLVMPKKYNVLKSIKIS